MKTLSLYSVVYPKDFKKKKLKQRKEKKNGGLRIH
jgi:hypothetical protein